MAKDDNFGKLAISSKLKYIATFLSGVALAAIVIGGSEKPIRSVDDIPNNFFTERRILEGDIIRVIDGDTYKFQYLSTWEKYFGKSKKSSNDAITVRVAAVDTPETPKRDQPGQRFGLEAKEFAKRKLEGKRVKLKLLKKDQYQRVLGVVRYGEGFRRDIDIGEELLKEGLATVYRQGGAQYDNRYDTYTKLETEAIQQRRGIWINGREGAELPSDYKKRLRTKASVNSL